MADSPNKTQAQDGNVAAFIAAVPDERRRNEAGIIDAMLRRVSGEEPVMWGPSIIGYGRYHYRYDSGREGDMCRIGFSPRKAKLVLYIVDGFPGHADMLARIGKHTTGQACLYITRLDAIDLAALEQLCAASWQVMQERYPAS
ncbi:MAG: DUF1801 domain-containing protein [Sphingopyxis sp.]|nr:DUF1801 domain-containing protein [Sphingopyxis sp.]